MYISGIWATQEKLWEKNSVWGNSRREECWFASAQSIYEKCCWIFFCIHYFLSAEVPQQMFSFMSFYRPFTFSQWRLDEILLHHRRYNPSGRSGPNRSLSIQSICTINPMSQACGLLLENILYHDVWRTVFYRQNDEIFHRKQTFFTQTRITLLKTSFLSKQF